MRIKSDKVFMNAEFIYSGSLYSGYLEGGPTVADNKRNLARVNVKAKKLIDNRTDIPITVIVKNADKEVVPGIYHIAWLDDGDNHAVIVWFDNGEQPAEVSLTNLIHGETWRNTWHSISKPFLI